MGKHLYFVGLRVSSIKMAGEIRIVHVDELFFVTSFERRTMEGRSGSGHTMRLVPVCICILETQNQTKYKMFVGLVGKCVCGIKAASNCFTHR